MEVYRLKHVPSGLYYKPGNPNLSKRGKVYFGGSNRLTYHKGPIICMIRIGSPMYKQLEVVEGIKWGKPGSRDICAYIPREQFIKEQI